MKRLTCEMCGSSDLIKENGVFVCQNCGTKYSVEEAKKMMVEGNVEVSGTVTVDNSESYLKRAEIFLKDREWDKAYAYYEKALDFDPENSKAYLGKMFCYFHCINVEEIKQIIENIDVTHDDNFAKAVNFNKNSLKEVEEIEQYNAYCREQEKQEEHIKRIERLADRAEFILENVFVAGRGVFALRADGTVLAYGKSDSKQYDVSEWKDIVKISSSGTHLVGLKGDGTVVAAGFNEDHQCDVSSWEDVIDIAALGNTTVGLRIDGTIVSSKTSGFNGKNIVKFYSRQEREQPEVFALLESGDVIEIGRWKIKENSFHVDGRALRKIVNSSGPKYFITNDGKVLLQGNRHYIEPIEPQYKKLENVRDITIDGSSVLKKGGSCLQIIDDYDDLCGCDVINHWHNIIQLLHNDQPINTKEVYGITEKGKLLIGGGDPLPLEDDESIDDYDEPWDTSGWDDLVALTCNAKTILGVKKNGTVLVDSRIGYFSEIKKWKVFEDPDEYVEQLKQKQSQMFSSVKDAYIKKKEQEKAREEEEKLRIEKEKQEKAEEINKALNYLYNERKAAVEEMNNLKGLLAGFKKKEIEKKINEIDEKINRTKKQLDI